MKRNLCCKLAALGLALLCALGATAQAATLSGLTATQLLVWYISSDSEAILCEEALGLTQELDFSPDPGNDSRLTYRWYRLEGDQALPVESGAAQGRLTVTTARTEQRYFCVATYPDGQVKYSAPYVVRAASADDAAAYLHALERLRSGAADEASYRQLAYQTMTGPWNVPLEGTNLAEAVLRAWQQAPDDLLCRCCIREDGVESGIMKAPREVHQLGCPWRQKDIMPPLPDQPQRYQGHPDGRQYVAGEEFIRPGTRAVLPEGGRAVVRSGLTGGCRWQVYDGTQWVSIAGEHSPDLTITTAKLRTIFRLTGTARLRCVAADGESTVTFTVAPGQAAAGEEPLRASVPAVTQARAVAEEPQSTYTVVIRYVFENNEVAAEPYVASLAAGSSFSATVANPTVVGYLPYVDGAAQSADSVVLSITDIQAPQTHTVVYKPTEVAYTVIHYQQNAQDDAYTEAAREIRQGLTNSTVPEVALPYEGFYALLYEHPAIAADGSTVVEVYYDRAYYLMHFDLDGGYGVEPIYARYGASIGDVGTPVRAGYTFLGWTQDGVETAIPAAMPARNCTYRALWAAEETAQVTVVFWGENANDADYSYLKSVPVQVKPGTAFTYDENGVLICSLKPHTHTDACYTCAQESHIHTAVCYDGVGTPSQAGINAPSNPVNGTVARQAWTTGDKVIYIGGTWYRYTGETAIGDVAPAICGRAENTHVHTDACLGCGETAHTHTDDCYTAGAGLDAALWTFVRSETVNVAADGSSVVNVYYDRTEKTLTFHYRYRNSAYQRQETITAKWGADISARYQAIAGDAGSTFWSASYNGGSPYTNYIGVMPEESRDYYNRGAYGDAGTMTYWGEDQEGAYTVKLFSVDGVGGYDVTQEDRYAFEGFTYHHGTAIGASCAGAAFYYTRNVYTLTLNDGYSDVLSAQVKYEAPLSACAAFVPEAPAAYEPGSVAFGGWYLNPECTGDAFLLENHSMPAENIILYARWVPVNHTVSFFLTREDMENGVALGETHPDLTVPHGAKVDALPEEPVHGSYTFVGWFYLENGDEKAFDFANMPIRRDMQVYARWSSNVLRQYTVTYQAEDTGEAIAAPTVGSALAGSTKTFHAKGGDALEAAWQEGYFPRVRSHSMTIDIADDAANTYTFWYVRRDAVPYTVRYVDAESGEPVADAKVVSDNRRAVVTENFLPVSGMMPDAYQKRLVVVADGGDNELVFYYTRDTVHAYYKITHYTQDTDGASWTEYASSQAIGDIGTIYTAEPLSIPGFTHDATVEGTLAEAELTANGLELRLYYTRNRYPYVVHHYLQGTATPVAADESGTAWYDSVLSRSAHAELPYYTPLPPADQSLLIRMEEGEEAVLNVLTFYYAERTATLRYEAVGPEGCGAVDCAGETVPVLTGIPQGSTPAPGDGFRFAGWFLDEGCTRPVPDAWVDERNHLTPCRDGEAWQDATYYAAFAYNLTTLTIVKQGMQDVDAGQSFLFRVTGQGLPAGGLRIAIRGNGSETISGLTVGETYTVTEEEGWSWRYTAQGTQQITLAPGGGTLTVNNTRDHPSWLSGDCYAENTFVPGTTEEADEQ